MFSGLSASLFRQLMCMHFFAPCNTEPECCSTVSYGAMQCSVVLNVVFVIQLCKLVFSSFSVLCVCKLFAMDCKRAREVECEHAVMVVTKEREWQKQLRKLLGLEPVGF